MTGPMTTADDDEDRQQPECLRYRLVGRKARPGMVFYLAGEGWRCVRRVHPDCDLWDCVSERSGRPVRLTAGLIEAADGTKRGSLEDDTLLEA